LILIIFFKLPQWILDYATAKLMANENSGGDGGGSVGHTAALFVVMTAVAVAAAAYWLK